MKFKKLLALLLCIAMVMSFAACGGGEEAPPADDGGDVVEEQGSVVEDAALAYFANFPADKTSSKQKISLQRWMQERKCSSWTSERLKIMQKAI